MDKNTKILIVDDFPTVRNIIKSVLNHLGYESLLEAEDGNSALPILRRENIGFVVTDWKMPGMEGIDLLKIIRQYSNHTELPVLMVTAEISSLKVPFATAAWARVTDSIANASCSSRPNPYFFAVSSA